MKKKSYVVNLNMFRKEVWVCYWYMKVIGIRLNVYEVQKSIFLLNKL